MAQTYFSSFVQMHNGGGMRQQNIWELKELNFKIIIPLCMFFRLMGLATKGSLNVIGLY